MKCKNSTKLSTATRWSIKIDGLILQHLRIKDLCTRIWFSVASRSAVDILMVTAFIVLIIRGKLLLERKDVPCYSLPIAILTRNQQRNRKLNK